MTKYKDLSKEDKEMADYVSMKWVRSVITSGALLILGAWMVISPEKPEHSYIEKASVSLLKDLWGLPFGIILLTIGLILMTYFVYGALQVQQYAWIRFVNGYYLYYKKRRVAGLASIYNNKDLLVFHPGNREVLKLENYKAQEYHKYFKAKPTTAFNNDDIYWSADESGYTLIYKGQNIADTTSEYRGDDLYVKSPSKFITVRMKNYKNSKDNVLRKGEMV